MSKVKRALISVWDKQGIVDFAKGLNKLGVEILSTGGTARILRENSISVKDVSEYTGFPEMLEGRVKTLHPNIHAGLLAKREEPKHMKQLQQHNIGLIDMVVVNLYPFAATISKSGVTLDEAIENIDIGGPTMLRSAAKNYESVAVVCNPKRYSQILEELRKNNGQLSNGIKRELATEVFELTSVYDTTVHSYLRNRFYKTQTSLAKDLTLSFEKVQDLRYGENPHQKASFYREKISTQGLANIKQLQGKELSFNNILDLNAACEIVKEFEKPTSVVIKHNNPCGVASNQDIKIAFEQAWKCDSLSAFGSIISFNRKVDGALASKILKKGFMECIVAPEFTSEAKEIFSKKKNLRVLILENITQKIKENDFKMVSGGLLMQDKDLGEIDSSRISIPTRKKPSKQQLDSLIFAWRVAKHVKSNAIVLAKGERTVGIGAGQMSRVDSVIISTRKAGTQAKNSALASDAFFPKDDAIKYAIKKGIKAIIQPGGSIADELIIKVADKSKIPMAFTGMRHFKH